MVDVSFLKDAMQAAGFKTNKALAEAAGVSYAAVGAILKRKYCNQFSADKLQKACGPHRIGPLVDLPVEALEEARALEGLPVEEKYQVDTYGHFPGGRPFFRDEAHGHLVVTGTRLDEDALVEWGVVVFSLGGEVVDEDWGWESHWLARDEGKRIAKDAAK